MSRSPVVRNRIEELFCEGEYFTINYIAQVTNLSKTQVRAALNYGERTGRFRRGKVEGVTSLLWTLA
jgi:Fic family protein